jgi:hypothetical protein
MGTHDTITDRLSEYLDGEIEAPARAEVEAHLRGCAECRAALSELREVAARAAALEDAPPERDLWPALHRTIEADQRRVAQFPARRRFSFTLPQLVAASLALMTLSGGMVWLARLGGDRTDFPPMVAVEPVPVVAPANFADEPYDRAIAELQETLEAGRTRLDAETVRVLEQNLESIDRAIEQCRRALAADPANVYLNGHLADAKKRKLALLRTASALAGT